MRSTSKARLTACARLHRSAFCERIFPDVREMAAEFDRVSSALLRRVWQRDPPARRVWLPNRPSVVVVDVRGRIVRLANPPRPRSFRGFDEAPALAFGAVSLSARRLRPGSGFDLTRTPPEGL